MEKWFFRTSKRVEDGGLKLHIHTGFPLVASNRPTTELTNVVKKTPRAQTLQIADATDSEPSSAATGHGVSAAEDWYVTAPPWTADRT
mmetsp:Transcript_53158/g.142132  ORF Transcript_53158/g.142132 Transcript_53158/m.142132 type:complete len:88 (-) Transcript_53158:569-832(-)